MLRQADDLWDDDELNEGWAVQETQEWSDDEEVKGSDIEKESKRQGQGNSNSIRAGKGNMRSKLNDEDDDEQDDSDKGGNESKAITIGQSDTQERSSESDEDERKGNNEQYKPTYNSHSGGMMRSVKESWDDESLDDSSVHGEGRWQSQVGKKEYRGEDMDSRSEKTIHVSDSTYDNSDDEGELATTDSEEIIALVIKNKANQKKQTKITNAFHLIKKEMDTMVHNNQNKPNNKETNKRVTRLRGLKI